MLAKIDISLDKYANMPLGDEPFHWQSTGKALQAHKKAYLEAHPNFAKLYKGYKTCGHLKREACVCRSHLPDTTKIKGMKDMGAMDELRFDGGPFCQEVPGKQLEKNRCAGERDKRKPLKDCTVKKYANEKMTGYGYKILIGGKSTTCSPPPSLQIAGQHKGYAMSIPNYAVPVHNFDFGFRELVGETKKCESFFDFKILECETCDCKDKQGRLELIKVNTTHGLVSNKVEPGCLIWFALADTAIILESGTW